MRRKFGGEVIPLYCVGVVSSLPPDEMRVSMESEALHQTMAAIMPPHDLSQLNAQTREQIRHKQSNIATKESL